MFEVLAVVCGGVFLLLTVGSLRALVRAESRFAPPTRPKQAAAVAAAFGFAAVVELTFVFIALREYPADGLGQTVQNFFGRYAIDAGHYMNIARYGYSAADTAFSGQELMIVFFPLYPLLLRLVNPVGVLPWHLTGMLVQLVIFPVGAGLFYRLAHRLLGPGRAGWALAFLLAMPGSFFFMTPMSDSLFFLLTSAFLLALLEERPGTAGVAGILAGLCRAPGALLAGAAGTFYLGKLLRREERFHPRWILAAGGPAAGLGLYLLLNRLVYGDWLRFTCYQAENWDQKLGFFWDTVRYHGRMFLAWLPDSPRMAYWLCLWAVGTLVFSLLILAAGRRLPAWMRLYGLAYYAMTNGASWLLSAPRYSLNNPALPLSLACLPRWARRAVLAVLLVLWAALFAGFVHRKPIF